MFAAVLRVEIALTVGTHRPPRPGGEKQLLRRRRQRAFVILCAAEIVDRVLDRGAFRGQALLCLIPNTDDVGDCERPNETGRKRFDLPFLLPYRHEQRVPAVALVFVAQPLS